MTAERKYISIDEVHQKGWLTAIFDAVRDELVAREGPQETPAQILRQANDAGAGEFFGDWLGQVIAIEDDRTGKPTPLTANAQSRRVHQTLTRIFTDGRYPPTSPQDIIDIMKEGNAYLDECVVNRTADLALTLKHVVERHLKAHTGHTYNVIA